MIKEDHDSPIFQGRAKISFDVSSLELDVPISFWEKPDCQAALKEWVWQNHKDDILQAMSIKQVDEMTAFEKAQRSLRLLDNISTVQRQYLQMEEKNVVFGTLLDGLLSIMESEYGFIGECKIEDDGRPYLQTHAVTNIAWNAATRAFYEENVDYGLKFYNMNTLFGACMMTAAPVVANNAPEDPRASGIPEGHPPLNYFLGIPFFEAGGTKMNGMVGLANKPGGYSAADIEFLEPFTVTCSNLIQAYTAIRQNKYLINTLEEKVKERTRELQAVNQDLEHANRRVVQASQAQLQHFACMSHEIRTPLNCIIGLSTLLQGTELNAYQEDSLKMIVTSGDLLLTVVNDVLDYSKLESGNVDITIQRSNLQEAMDAVVHSIAEKSRSKDLVLKTFYDASVPEFMATDYKRLQQILYNLLGNAIKFSPKGGTVELRVELLRREEVFAGEVKEEGTHIVTGPKHQERESRTEPLGHQTQRDKQESHCPFSSSQEGPIYGSKCPFSKTEKEKAPNAIPPAEEKPLIVRIPRTQLYQAERDTLSVDLAHVTEGSSNRSPFYKHEEMSASNTSFDTMSEFSTHTQDYNFSTYDTSEHPTVENDIEVSDISVFLQRMYQYYPLRSSEMPGRKSEIVLRFSIKDYGTGIKKENFSKIFRPFKQANSDTERIYGGTGLGLAITAKLVKGLGGSISVDSKEGEWSEFSVDLPFSDPPADVEGVSDSLRDTTILAVMNEDDESRNLSRVFGAYQVDCVSFKNMDALKEHVNKDVVRNMERPYICLVHEDLYSPESYRELSTKMKSALMTFGPKYCIEETSAHYRSLSQVLPSVLLKSISSLVNSGAIRSEDKYGNNGTSIRRESVMNHRDLKVLVAEDNLINQKVLVRMLARLGVKNVEVVSNGQEAVDREAQNEYDIVYMDWQMPVMDGIDACRLIVERREARRRPKVIFVTANVSGHFEFDAKAAGGDGYITKPFNTDQIENSFNLLETP